MKMKIMVCHDGSENAQQALDEALKIFKPNNPEIILVTVVEGPADASSVNEELTAKMVQERHDFLKKTSDMVAGRGFDVDAIMAVGDARAMIIETVKQKNPDIVVIGKRGAGVIKEMVLGSVSAYLVRHVKCPALVFHT
ncbi:Putative universal stress protein [uncultured bacterium]|nr:Putative universal stress protein [uncultured bacterium]